MASDYSTVGLNDQLFSSNSLLTRTENDYTTYQQFDAGYEGLSANKITNGNIRGVIDLGNNYPGLNQPFIRFDGTADRVLFNDGTSNRFFFGNNNGTAAVKMSKLGQDVLTAGSESLIFSSDFNLNKIVAHGTVSVTKLANQTSAIESIAHGFSVTPELHCVVLQGAEGYFENPLVYPVTDGPAAGLVDVTAFANVNGPDVNFNVWTPNFVGAGYYGVQNTWDFIYTLYIPTGS